ncbi:MAG: LysE family translocator [Cucumibacter sp.]
MQVDLVASFLLLALPTYFTPGPNNLMLMTSTAKFGVGRTLRHALGICIGFPIMVFGVGLGLGELFAAYPWVKTAMRYAAAAYFLWMAWHLLGIRITAGGQPAGRPMTFIEAVAFQWVNPKAWAMATSFVAALVVSGEGRLASILWLTLGAVAVAPFSTALWMLFGQQLALWLKRTGLERSLGMLLAALMVAAVALFVF